MTTEEKTIETSKILDICEEIITLIEERTGEKPLSKRTEYIITTTLGTAMLLGLDNRESAKRLLNHTFRCFEDIIDTEFDDNKKTE